MQISPQDNDLTIKKQQKLKTLKNKRAIPKAKTFKLKPSKSNAWCLIEKPNDLPINTYPTCCQLVNSNSSWRKNP
jgi:hypothetical protein